MFADRMGQYITLRWQKRQHPWPSPPSRPKIVCQISKARSRAQRSQSCHSNCDRESGATVFLLLEPSHLVLTRNPNFLSRSGSTTKAAPRPSNTTCSSTTKSPRTVAYHGYDTSLRLVIGIHNRRLWLLLSVFRIPSMA